MKIATSQQLSNKLVQYSALSIALAGMADANGQIVYTPNINFGGPNLSYPLDFDGDTFIDATIRHRAGSRGILDVLPSYASGAIRGNNYNYSSQGSYIYPLALNYGDPIGVSNTDWNPSAAYFQKMDFFGSCGNPGYRSLWCGATNKYLGIRFHIGGNIHYGWARLDVDNSAQVNWVIKDYAYNPLPDQPLFAGEGGSLGIDDYVFSKIKIVALNKSIALYNLPENISYKLFSISGQSVLDGKIESGTYVIEAKTLASSIYILELVDTNSKAVFRKKVIL